MVGIFDVEYNSLNGFKLFGLYDGKKYRAYFKAGDFIQDLIKNDIKQVFCYNLDYDFQHIVDYCLKYYTLYIHFNRNGMIYVDLYARRKRIIFKDLAFHCGMKKVETLAKWLGLKKTEIDYDKMSMQNVKEVMKGNKNHCVIEYKIHQRLLKIYSEFGCTKVRATVGSNAMKIYQNKFINRKLFFGIPQKTLQDFQEAYQGGYCEAFKEGYFKGEFTEIDVNSLYPFIMLDLYPFPEFYKIKKIEGNELFYLVRTEKGIYSNYDIELLDDFSSVLYYYVFPKVCYPFRRYVNAINKLKEKADAAGNKFDRKIYKLLDTSLYGKFAQLGIRELIVQEKNIEKYKKRENVNIIQYRTGIYKVWYETKFPYWTNFVWSLFTTSRARLFLFNAIQELNEMGKTVHYCDTDSAIFRGNTDKIKLWIDSKKIGKWKIKSYCKNGFLDIRGKKFFDFDGDIRCKGIGGIGEERRKNMIEFFKKGNVKIEKFVKMKEKLKKDLLAGSMTTVKKRDIRNRKEKLLFS